MAWRLLRVPGAASAFRVARLRPGMRSRGQSDAESADGRPAILRIVPQPDRDYRVGFGAHFPGKTQGQKQVAILAIDGHAPAGFRIAIDSRHGRVLGGRRGGDTRSGERTIELLAG